jgi:hypothetical protein
VPLKRGFVPVAFDDLAWQNDLSKTTGSASGSVKKPALGWNVRGRQ